MTGISQSHPDRKPLLLIYFFKPVYIPESDKELVASAILRSSSQGVEKGETQHRSTVQLLSFDVG